LSDGAFPESPLMTPDETSEDLTLAIEQLRAIRERNAGPEFYSLSPRLIRHRFRDSGKHPGNGHDLRGRRKTDTECHDGLAAAFHRHRLEPESSATGFISRSR
jgi:hypothetical protein